MSSWAEFAGGDPDLAAIAGRRMDASGLVLVGTLRANGWPRISPVEPLVVDGTLYLGMMWQSRKAVDLLRDPRCVVHTVVTDKGGTEGDVKIYGRARDITDVAERERYCVALEAAIGWRPSGEEYHLFGIDITEVGYFAVVGGDHDVRTWAPTGGAGATR
ncbi:MAG TPA: pyridoxamine 5'-phosphate oxidase family protein [Acidimicrobiales bacterium]|nr:pyridoxamine 5'-phosphate oxidase family protein [Acidimicrobiales bacterium]